MTFEQALQLIFGVGTLITTWQTTRRGYHVILDKLSSYITVEEHSKKMNLMWDKINEQAIKIARLEERAAK